MSSDLRRFQVLVFTWILAGHRKIQVIVSVTADAQNLSALYEKCRGRHECRMRLLWEFHFE